MPSLALVLILILTFLQPKSRSASDWTRVALCGRDFVHPQRLEPMLLVNIHSFLQNTTQVQRMTSNCKTPCGLLKTVTTSSFVVVLGILASNDPNSCRKRKRMGWYGTLLLLFVAYHLNIGGLQVEPFLTQTTRIKSNQELPLHRYHLVVGSLRT